MNSQLLQQAEASVEKGVKPDQHDAFNRIVVAGMKALFSPQSHQQIFSGLDKSQDPAGDVGKGAVGLLIILQKQSKGTMPVGAMIPAGMVLMLHGLDFIDQSGIQKIGNNELAEATRTYFDALMPKLGLTPDKTQQIMAQAQGVMNDPQKMKMIQGG